MSQHKIKFVLLFLFTFLLIGTTAKADLTLTSGNNATTTPNVATAITGFQIVGPAASTTPVKLFSTNGTLAMTTTTGLTFTGSPTGSVIYFSGTVANINAALSTLTYTRSGTGTDTLEVSLVPFGEAFFTGNNHLYKFISGSISWNSAFSAAQTLTAYGVPGYLATITSSAENTFVSGRLTGDGWIGASDAASEGNWKWVAGPESGTQFWSGNGGGSTVGGNYAAWNPGEPNDSGGSEDCAETYVASGMWNDLDCSSTISGYVAEFGTASNTPTVVAKNISVVTADVPAITSLSPLNGSLLATANQNLVIGFSKTVNGGTGTIVIKKTSDDSTVETINASSSLVTGNGTNTITINPNTTLSENVSYYVTLSGDAFKDASNNFFSGISDKTTWTFTILDQTPPTITNVATSSVATTSATITWTTNEQATSKIIYSTGSTFTSTTTESDTSPRVTSHSKSITGLPACTTFNYKVVSGDAAGNYATSSTAGMFTTLGCPAPTISATTTTATVATTSVTSLTENGKTLTVTTPPNFTATSSTVVIQIKSLDSQTSFASTSKPADLTSAASVVFDVTALVNSTTVLDSFDTPVTISYKYTDEEIAGLDEATITMYHFHNGQWLKLNACSVDQNANVITCSAPSFSIFAIFGNIASSPKRLSQAPGSATTKLGCKDPKATNYDYFSSHVQSLCTYAAAAKPAQASVTSVTFTRTLKLGMTGNDVKALQQFLNTHGFVITTSGVGSAGNETTSYGSKTAAAVKKFQEAYASSILAGQKLKVGTGIFGPMSILKANSMAASGVNSMLE